MLKINKNQIKKFAEIKDKAEIKIKDNFQVIVHSENYWKGLSNNEIWFTLVKQVMVVGGSPSADYFDEFCNKGDKDIKNIEYETLLRIKDEKELKRRIYTVLRKCRTRYASRKISRCRKTNALVYNFGVLKEYGGPKELLKNLSGLGESNDCNNVHKDKEKVKFVMKKFKYLKSKGARDFLMDLGLVKNAIALDSRIKKIFEQVGIELPKRFENNPKIYDAIEEEILTKICKPLGLSGVEFDRLLYQNLDKILVKLYVIKNIRNK